MVVLTEMTKISRPSMLKTASILQVPDSSRVLIFVIPALVALIHAGITLFLGAHPVVDDTYIFLRYAGNLVDGNGLVFNIGEKVEGFTSPAWVGLAALAMSFKLPALQILQIVGLLLFAATAGLTGRLARSLGSTTILAVLAGCSVAACASFFFYALSGMETAAFAFSLIFSLICVVKEHSRGIVAGWRSGVWLAVATLIRPEGLGVAVVVWSVSLLMPGPSRTRISWLGVAGFLSPVLAYEIFRLAYFGAWLPNTFYAKVDANPDITNSIHYLASSGVYTPIWVLSAALFACGLRWSRQSIIGLAAAVSLLGWVVWVGGDYLPFSRFLIPIIPMVAALAAARLANRRPLIGIIWLGLASLWALAPQFTSPNVRMPDRVVERGRVAARWIATNMAPEALLATSAIGVVGAEGGTRILDMYGIVDAGIARNSDPSMKTGHPGHERGDPSAVLSRQPDVIFFGLNWVREIPMSEKSLWANSIFLSPSEREILMSQEFANEYMFFNTLVEKDRWLGMAVRRQDRSNGVRIPAALQSAPY